MRVRGLHTRSKLDRSADIQKPEAVQADKAAALNRPDSRAPLREILHREVPGYSIAVHAAERRVVRVRAASFEAKQNNLTRFVWIIRV